MRVLVFLCVFVSVATLASASLKDIGVLEQHPIFVPSSPQSFYQRLHAPVQSFPCGLLGLTNGSTCVYHRLCVSLAGVLKTVGLFLLVRVAAVKYFNGGRKVAVVQGVAATEKLRAAFASQLSAPSGPSQAVHVGKLSDDPANASCDVTQQQTSTSPAAAPRIAGPGKLAKVVTALHILTAVSVKANIHHTTPVTLGDDSKDLCLPITAPPPATHLFTAATSALSSTLHRCILAAVPAAATRVVQQQGWQVPSAPYLPINNRGASLSNWASAVLCCKRPARPPRPRAPAPGCQASNARHQRPGTTVFHTELVPELQPQHLTSAQAPSMTAGELVLVNRVLDMHLNNVCTAFLFD